MEPGKLPLRHRLGRWGIAALVLAMAPAGIITARQLVQNDVSPAQGAAQVVAQGLAKLPDGDLVWRLVERTAQPRGESESGTRVTGYVLARDEPILLTEVRDGLETDVAFLAPGEAYLVPQGTQQIRSSMGDQPATYLSFELVAADAASQTGSGTLVFATDAFDAPDGLRDLDLVANVLGMGDSSDIPTDGGQVAVVAARGAVDVTSADGSTRTLSAGETAIFQGPVTVTGAGSLSVPAVRAFVPLLQGNDDGAVYYAAVIGREVIPSAEFTPGATAPSVVATAPPLATEPPVEMTEGPATAELTSEPTSEPTLEPTVEPTEPALNSDDDQDGLIFRSERAIGTDPNVADTDGDGYNDGEEVDAETDPLDPNSFPIIIT